MNAETTETTTELPILIRLRALVAEARALRLAGSIAQALRVEERIESALRSAQFMGAEDEALAIIED